MQTSIVLEGAVAIDHLQVSGVFFSSSSSSPFFFFFLVDISSLQGLEITIAIRLLPTTFLLGRKHRLLAESRQAQRIWLQVPSCRFQTASLPESYVQSR